MTGVETGLRLEDYLENWDFWTAECREFLMSNYIAIRKELEEIDEKDPSKLSEEDFKNLEELASDLRVDLLKFLVSFTGRFEWAELINNKPYQSDNPPSKHRNEKIPFFLGSSAIIDKNLTDYILMMHSHADGALGTEEYIKAAEQFLEDSMWLVGCYRGKIHGVLMIGGKVSFYQRCGGRFSPIAGAKEWAPVDDKEVLSRILGIVMRAWRDVKPYALKNLIVGQIKARGGTVLRDFDGFVADNDDDYRGGNSSDESGEEYYL